MDHKITLTLHPTAKKEDKFLLKDDVKQRIFLPSSSTFFETTI